MFDLLIKQWALEPLLDALLTVVFRYSAEKALLLISCFPIDTE